MFYDGNNPLDVQNARLKLNKLIDKKCVFELTEKKPKRSLSQNSYLHLILSYFAVQYGCGTEESKVRFYKCTCNSDLFWRDNPKRPGERYLRSSSDLDTREMTLSIERFRNWSVQKASIYLPSPEDELEQQAARLEIERNKSFVYE
jgi:hypothetical protein